MVNEAIIPDKRAREPADKFTKVCAIIGQPPIPKKKPFKIFALPCAIHSLFPSPFVSVISSTKFKVSKPSVNPTAAIIIEYGAIIINVSHVNGIFGIWNGGKPPLTDAISFTVLVSIFKK